MPSGAERVVPILLRACSAVASMVSMLVGLLVLVGGWAFGIEAIKAVVTGLATMKTNTAFAFGLGGAALWALRDEAASPRRRVLGVGAACILGVLATLTLAESLTGADVGIDELLARDPLAVSGGLLPGRMSPFTALCFLMLAVALLGLDRPRLFRLGQRCAVAAGFVGFLNLVAYAYSVRSLELTKSLTSYTEMAVHTAGTLVALSVGIAAARPGRGATGIFVKQTAGGTVARWLLPVALFGPVILGAARLWGEREGYYGFEFGVALMAVSNLSMFSALGWWVAVRLHHTDVQRLRAEQELRQLNATLEGQVRLRTAELTASESRYRHLTEQSAEGIVIHQGGFMRLVNHAAARLLGYDSTDDAVGQPITRHLSPDLRENILARIQARLRGEDVPATNEMEMLRQDGRRFWVEATAAVVEWQGASATRVALVDVTERRRAEEALRERETQLRSLGDNLPDGTIYQVVRRPDGSNYFPYMSEGQMGLYGLTREHTRTDPSAVYALLVAEDAAKLRAAADESMERLEPFEVDCRLRTPHGEHRWLQIRGRPRRLPDGSTLWDAIALDVSERKRAEESARHATALREVAALANATAHEINNPLTVVEVSLELLEAKSPDQATSHVHINRAQRAIRRITSMIEHMQRITHLERLGSLDTAGVDTLDLRGSSDPRRPTNGGTGETIVRSSN